MSNDSALYVTGSVALSQSLYVSWGPATGSATTVGIRQNDIGTLEFKDNATGSWTEFGSSFDDTTLGDAASDVITINGQLTASADAQFNSNVTLGNACTDSIQVSGSLTASCDTLILDDKKIYFGSHKDASIEYDEDGNNRLIISGAYAGIEVTGSMYISGSVYANQYVVDTVTTTVTNIEQQGSTKFGDSSDDTHEFTGSLYVSDDSKIYFGADNDASIEYDEDGTDELIISGALGGIDIQVPVNVADAFTFSADGTAYMTINTIGSGVTKFAKTTQHFDDVELFFGTGYDASIEYDEDGRNRLIISGSTAGIEITGSTSFQDVAYFCGGIAGCSPLQIDTDALLVDDKRLYFGTNQDASIEYDENGRNRLIISGSTNGTELTGSLYLGAGANTGNSDLIVSDPLRIMWASQRIKFSPNEIDATSDQIIISGSYGTAFEAGNSVTFEVDGDTTLVVGDSTDGIRIKDDTKLYFGTHSDASIKYDETGRNRLIISGSTAGTEITGSVYHTGSLIHDGDYNLSGTLTITGPSTLPVLVMDDSDASAQIGRTHIGYDGTNSDMAVFAHQDMATQTDFALRQRSTGQTEINAKSGQSISFKLASANKAILNSSGHFNLLDDIKLLFGTNEDASIEYDENGTDRLIISGSTAGIDITGSVTISGGDVTPYPDNSINLGSSAYRWANVYTADLHLKNDRGDWTIIEEDDYLCVVNNKTNKRYKMMLEEIKG